MKEKTAEFVANLLNKLISKVHVDQLSAWLQSTRPRNRAVEILDWLVAIMVAALLVVSLGNAEGAEAGTRNCFGKRPTISGTADGNVLIGRSGNDTIASRGGSDRVVALTGNDRVCGGRGSDNLQGGPGFDKVRGGAGYDVCVDFEVTRGCEQFD